jgi:ParG protein
MSKTLAFKIPPKPVEKAADQWVGEGVEPHLQQRTVPTAVPAERMKRLTIDVSENLHARIKVGCAKGGVKIADKVRELLEKHFPELS